MMRRFRAGGQRKDKAVARGQAAAAAGEASCSGAASSIDEAPMTPFLRKVVFFSSGGSFLDGYVLSLIGVALTQVSAEMGMSTAWSAAVGASALAGIFFGTLLGGRMTDAIGRRLMFIVDVVSIAVLSVWGAFASDPLQLFSSRFLIGLFIGADYPIATALITEFVPKDHRATSMGVVSGSWYLGATVAAFVGYALFGLDDGWRWMLASSVVPCLVLLVGRRDIPESPRWLVHKGRLQEAEQVMSKVYGQDVALPSEEQGVRAGFKDVFKKGYAGRMAFVAVIILCQVVPMYAIYTFGPTIMELFGLGAGRASILGETVISVMFLVGTVPAMFWLNSWGRRPLLVTSMAFMCAGLVVLGLFPDAPTPVVVTAFGVYAFFSGGPGILQWLYPNELFPTEVRATAVGVAIAFSRIGTVIATYGLPIFMGAYGVGPTMLVGAALVAVGLAWSIASAPETKGKSLDEASSL